MTTNHNEVELRQKMEEKASNLNGMNRIRLPRRKFVPRNPNLHKFAIQNELKSYSEREEIPIISLLQQTTQIPIINPPFQKIHENNEMNFDSLNDRIPISSHSTENEVQLTVTPDLNYFSEQVTSHNNDNQINLKKTKANVYPCPLCPSEATLGYIRLHLFKDHALALQDNEIFHICLVCKNPVKSNDIFAHILSHDYFETDFDCNYCDAKFFYENRLEQHLEKNHEVFQCKSCEMTIYSKQDWKTHKRTFLHKMKGSS
uniref:CSON009419 protein n=1 Tax=Culicoides sonorensis TaxID=179676 RepID=A0A336M0A6_CULSO